MGLGSGEVGVDSGARGGRQGKVCGMTTCGVQSGDRRTCPKSCCTVAGHSAKGGHGNAGPIQATPFRSFSYMKWGVFIYEIGCFHI